MPIIVRLKTLFHCKCIFCGKEWDTDTVRGRCSRCKRTGWNGEDFRLPDPYRDVPVASQIEIGTKVPAAPSIEALLEPLTIAQSIVSELIAQNPCNHPEQCVCAEKATLKQIDQQVEKLKALQPRRSTYLINKSDLVNAKTMGEQLNVSEQYVHRLALRGRIPSQKMRKGSRIYRRYDPAAVKAALAKEQVEQ